MSVLAPPEPPRPDELEALIPEARSRQRRRWLFGAGALALAVGVGLSVWAASPDGGKAVVRGHGPIRVVAGHVSGKASFRQRGIGDVGSSGGVTWAISGHGIWLTTSGGRTWRRSVPRGIAAAGLAVASPPDVQFVNKRVGWMSGLSGSARRWEFDWTADGGRTWRLSMPPGCQRVCDDGSFSFLDARHGYLFAAVAGAQAPNKLFRTSDGGRSWQLVSQPSIWGPITFVNADDGFAGGPGRIIIGDLVPWPALLTLYRTTDGGRTWSKYDPAGSGSFTELPYSSGGREVQVVENGPNRDGGLNLAAATVYASHDSGHHWIGRAVPSGLAVEASFSAASPGVWAWASGQDVFVTDRAGNGWRKVTLRGLPSTARIKQIDFTSSRVGWATFYGFGTHPDLFRTVDGGLHWTPAGPKAREHPRRG